MMWKDEIVEEVRAVREAYAARFDYDVARMFEGHQEERTGASRAACRSQATEAAKRKRHSAD
jgi:hypothetical protein